MPPPRAAARGSSRSRGARASPDTGSLTDRLARAITLAGPISLAQFMGVANGHYYATRDPLGAGGDFTTAPEISQMFGELIGLWCADLWDRVGRPDAAWVELGPGRGTLAADAMRAMAKAGLAPPVHLVETSPVLRAPQAERMPHATWHDAIDTLPTDRPLIVVANEFFDALPIRQLVRGADGWFERLVACQDTLFLPIAGKQVPDAVIPEALRNAPAGSVIETSPASVAILRALAQRIVAQGGALLVIDYGYEGPAIGDTLQAVRGHAFANPFDAPGEQDLTAHVDFGTLGAAASVEGARVVGLVGQGAFLTALGIDQRAAALAAAAPGRANQIGMDKARLTREMGDLFQVIAVTAPRWPQTGGFRMITYRDARTVDGPALAAMARQSFTETFGTLYRQSDLAAFLDEAFGANGLPSQLSDPDFAIRLAMEGDRIIGFVKMGPVTFPGEWRPDAIELYQFYVLGPWQGQGVAQELMAWSLGHARDHGAREVILSVYVDNHRAHRFYEKYGFEDIGRIAFHVGETVDDDNLMRLAL